MTHTLFLKKPLAVFDLETTGVNIASDRIIEISIIKANPNGTVEIKTRRINPEIPIPLESSLIHGIYEEDIKEAPTFKKIGKSLAQFLEGCDLAGFNSNRFDIPILVEEFLRNDINFSVSNRKMVDVQRLFHLMEPRNLSAAYRNYCQKELENAHSAEADALATLEVLQAMIKKYDNVSIKDDKGKEYIPIKNNIEDLHQLTAVRLVDFAQRFSYNAQGVEVINFGKHLGKPIEQILKEEPSYYDWMMRGQFTEDTKRKLTEIKLRMMNK